MSTARDTLNRARWERGDLHELAVTVVHRGAPSNVRTLSGARIVDIGAGGIALTPELAEGEGVFVPYHRFLAIHAADGALLWDRRGTPLAPVHAPAAPVAREPVVAQGRELAPAFSVVLSKDDDLVLDGSAGEGGGQILRSALTLAMWTGKPFVIERIRGRRKRPGLLRQHLTCVQAAAAVCGAEVEGAALGSRRLAFRPGACAGGTFAFDIGSAGSVSLVLQTLALPLALSATPSEVTVRGGTHALWAPIYAFLAEAWLPPVRKAGARIDLTLRQPGFHPAGGGEVVMRTAPSSALTPLHLVPAGGAPALEARAIVAGLPEGIVRRELAAVAELLASEPVALHSATVRSAGPGNAMWLTARDGASGRCNVFSGIGVPGIPAEEVAREVVDAFVTHRQSGATVEPHLADQLLLPIAMANGGSFTTSALTLHSLTNIEVIHAFTSRRLRARELGPDHFQVTL